MSRSDGSARPPLPFDTDVREVRGILRPSMGEVDWSIEATLVDERGIHFIATCYCPECRGIRDEQDFIDRPQHRWFGKCSLPDCVSCARERAALERDMAEDAAEQEHRASWHWMAPPQERAG